jgi:hypothetical protein
MAWWAGAGAAVGLGSWAITFIVNYREDRVPRWSSACDRPGIEVPGYHPDEEENRFAAPGMALQLPLVGALGGAALGWFMSLSESVDPGLQLAIELVAFTAAAFVLVRTMRDIPAVGEAPPDDPDKRVAVRVRNAALKLAATGFMLAMMWLTLN